jgi:transcriptional regulator with XRE-family HTH domain
MPAGAPTKYDPKYCGQLIAHMAGGLSYESFAAVVGVRRSTLYNWEKENPEFLDAKEKGVDLNLLFYERLGRAALVGQEITIGKKKIKLKNFNTTLWIFNMKNRHGWRDKQDLDHTHHFPEPFVVTTSDGEVTKMGVEKK